MSGVSTGIDETVLVNGNPISYGGTEPSGTDWTQYQYDDQNTGYAADLTGPTDSDGVAEKQTHSAILIDSGGFLYHTPSEDELVKEKDGTLEWSYQVSAGEIYQPELVDGTVYFVDGDGVIHALNADDGSEQYTKSTESSGGFINIHDGTIYETSSAPVVARDASDGSLLWSQFDFNKRYAAKPSYYNDKLLVCDSGNNNLEAIDPSNGSVLWTYNGDLAEGPPAVMDGTAYVGLNIEGMAAINTSDGSLKWSTETTPNPIEYGVAVHPDAVVGADDSGNIFAHDPADGALLWEKNNSYDSRVPVIAGDNVYLSLDGIWYGYNVQDGTKLFEFLGTANADNPPTPYNGTLWAPHPPAT